MNAIKQSSKSLLRLSMSYDKTLHPAMTRCYSARNDWKDDELDLTLIEETPKYSDVLTDQEKEEIMRKRNKSGLQPSHRNQIYGLRPYDVEHDWYHKTIRYKRRVFGRYGMNALDVPIGALWLTKEGIDDRIDYEKTAYPNTLQESWAILEQKKKDELETIRQREEEIDKKLAKVSQWEAELNAKVAKKEAEIKIAQEKKARLIEEVRRQIGYEISPKDIRFKEALEMKEKEERKRRKESKKQERAAKIMARLLEQSQKLSATIDQKGATPETPAEPK